jgi:hypothetical protein
MSDKKLIISAVLVLILIGIVGAVREYKYSGYHDEWDGTALGGTDNDGMDDGVYCTMDARLCPDGSYVGRTGPKCEFSACPSPAGGVSTSTEKDVLTGQLLGFVTTAPTCPVQRVPEDPACAPKPYATTIIARVSATGKEVGRTESNANGRFMMSFLPGSYDIEALGGNPLPRCETKTVTLMKAATTTVDLSCDIGIR